MTSSGVHDTGPGAAATGPAIGQGSLIARLAGSRRVSRIFGIALMVLAVLAGLGTYAAFTGLPPFGDDTDLLVVMVYIDLAIMLLLGFVIARRVVALWSARRRGSAGSRLHVRLVAMFSALSVTPAIIVSTFSLLFFDLGIESWFSDRVRTAVSESRAVAESYLVEHRNNIRTDALRMARDLNRDARQLQLNPALLNRTLDIQRRVRDLSEAIIFRGTTQEVLARSGITLVLELEPIPAQALQSIADGEILVLTGGADDRVRALMKLDAFADAYLYIGRLVDPQVLARIDQVRGAAAQFERLETQRSDLQLSFALAFVVVAILLLLSAIWIGLTLATQLSAPISALIGATERVRSGDLDARVTERAGDDELALLIRAFNRMTAQLNSQHQELMEANRQIDGRRRFSEAVLAGVSAGVIGLDRKGRVDLPNRRATELLGMTQEALIGERLSDLLPELEETMRAAETSRGARPVEAQIRLSAEGETRTLFVRIVAERDGERIQGYVATFDDVSPLIAAQRKAAWADVARRIAHEIKNPLTPIQLSAERLKRKYRKEVQTDPHVFENCIDTIVRQVDDIGRMVDEFSSFARMPAPTMRVHDIVDIGRQSLFLQRNANQDTEYLFDGPEEPIAVRCDSRQISQVLTNLLQNAQDAIEGRLEQARDDGEAAEPQAPGRIGLSIAAEDGHVRIAVQDNGKGLPEAERERLTEPYMTTRKKGTGLGLAIVKKIMEDHGGELSLDDAPGGGALIVLRLPRAGHNEDGDGAGDAPDASEIEPGGEYGRESRDGL
jgi:two-component system nitrogen regulation sensor histidine kinase NtrY